MATPSLAAIVLAGGESKRMGQDKALLLINGVPLLQRVCEAALHCTPLVYVITFRSERYGAIVPANCRLLQEQAAAGETEPHGPLVGFAQALETMQREGLQAEWVLLLACDLPRLSGATLHHWSKQLATAEDTIALLPKAQEGWEPLCGFYRTNCLTSLQSAIARGDRSFQRWLTQISVRELRLENRHMLLNCNTPQDLERVRHAELAEVEVSKGIKGSQES